MSECTVSRLQERCASAVFPLFRIAPLSGAMVVGDLRFFKGECEGEYDGCLVLVTAKVTSIAELEQARLACRNATALVLASGLDPSLATEVQASDLPVFVPVPEASQDAVIRSLVAATLPELACGANALTAYRDDLQMQRQRESALLGLLQGTGSAADHANTVGLRPDLDHVVVAAAVGVQAVDTYVLALAAEFPEAHTVLTEGLYISILAVPRGTGATSVAARLQGRIGRAVRSSQVLHLAVGLCVPGIYRIHEAHSLARQILRAMQIKVGAPWASTHGSVRVATQEDVVDALVLIRAGDALRSLGPASAEQLEAVAAYDEERGTELLVSILVSLEHIGNMTEAARALGVHANTLRGRLKRAKEIAGIDLDEPVSTLRTIVAFLAYPTIHRRARAS